jgi:hypothetical protein
MEPQTQNSAPTSIFVVKRGFLRIVRRMANDQDSCSYGISKPGTLARRGSIVCRLIFLFCCHFISSLIFILLIYLNFTVVWFCRPQGRIPSEIEGKLLEIGLIGPTHFFGAVAVLEHGHVNLSNYHLISCCELDVLTLSRADVGKVF